MAFSEWVTQAAADDQSEPMAIRDLVAVQAGAILATITHALPTAPAGE